VRVLVQQLVVQLHGHALLALLALVLVAQQVLVGNDVAPVVPAGLCTHSSTWLKRARPAMASRMCRQR
jgi:hypothetical protein